MRKREKYVSVGVGGREMPGKEFLIDKPFAPALVMRLSPVGGATIGQPPWVGGGATHRTTAYYCLSHGTMALRIVIVSMVTADAMENVRWRSARLFTRYY